MFKMLLCQCCTQEASENPELLLPNNEEHSTLPVLLDPKSQVVTKEKAEAMLSGADLIKTTEALLPDGPSVPLQKAEVSIEAPTATQDAKSDAQPKSSAKMVSVEAPTATPDYAQPKSGAEMVPGELAEPEAETEETALEDAHSSVPVANDHDDPALPAGTERARAPQTGRDSVASKTPEEIAAEFKKRAVSSVPCTHFNESTGRRIRATYKLSSDLKQLTIEADKRGVFSRFSVTVPVADVHDVDNYDGSSNLLKPKAAATLKNEDAEKFVTIFYESQKGDMTSVCLIESSVESRVRLTIGLKALIKK